MRSLNRARLDRKKQAKSIYKYFKNNDLTLDCDVRVWHELCSHKGEFRAWGGRVAVKKIARLASLPFVVLLIAPRANAQVTIGNDLKMNMGGVLNAGYSGVYGDEIPSSHGLTFGGSAELNGSYYNPNFLNFSVTPYYNQSRNDSNFQSLTDASGVNATANLFTGSRYPGYVDYSYAHNSTGIFGLISTPNFTTIGDSHGFGVGWSLLVPNKPTLSVSYSQGSGTGNIYGTNEESNSSTKTFNARSSYALAGWNLNAFYTFMKVDSTIPVFLGGEQGNDFLNSTGNNLGVSGYRSLPWNGSLSLGYNYSTYSGTFNSDLFGSSNATNYTTNTQTALLTFHPTQKLTLFANEMFTDNLNGYLYQGLINGGSGLPLQETNTTANSLSLSSGASYLILPNLFSQAQITYYKQMYAGHSYDGSYVSGTIGYNKKILHTFTVAATVIESSNQWANNSLGFIANLTAYRNFWGGWEASGAFTYAQNVQTILVTYTTSYSNYNANLHKRLGRGKQWTGAFNGSHSGFSQYQGYDSHSEAFSTSLALRRFTLTGNYVQSSGQSLLTSTGIQPLPPTPILPQEGLIVYDGQSYGGSVGFTPIARLSITGTYSHATSHTLSNEVFSKNRSEIYYAQMQYRLRQLNLLAGYTHFSQGFSAAGTPAAATNSYFIGVSRWINFF